MATTAVEVGTMKVAQIPKPGEGFQVVERAVPTRAGVGVSDAVKHRKSREQK